MPAQPKVAAAITSLGRSTPQTLPVEVVDSALRRRDHLRARQELTTLEIEELIHKAHAQTGIYLRHFRAAHRDCWKRRKPEQRRGGEHTWPTFYNRACFEKWWAGYAMRRKQAKDERDAERHATEEAEAKLNDALARRIQAAKEILRDAGEALTPEAILDRARDIRYAWLTHQGRIIDSLLLPQTRSTAGDIEMLTLTDAVCRRQWEDPEIARPWITLWQRVWRGVEEEPAKRVAERQQARLAAVPVPRRRRKPV